MEETLASYLSPSLVVSWKEDTFPSRQCRATSSFVSKAYVVVGHAGIGQFGMGRYQIALSEGAIRLSEAPFEQDQRWFLMLKMTFLLACTSLKRGGNLQALQQFGV